MGPVFPPVNVNVAQIFAEILWGLRLAAFRKILGEQEAVGQLQGQCDGAENAYAARSARRTGDLPKAVGAGGARERQTLLLVKIHHAPDEHVVPVFVGHHGNGERKGETVGFENDVVGDLLGRIEVFLYHNSGDMAKDSPELSKPGLVGSGSTGNSSVGWISLAG